MGELTIREAWLRMAQAWDNPFKFDDEWVVDIGNGPSAGLCDTISDLRMLKLIDWNTSAHLRTRIKQLPKVYIPGKCDDWKFTLDQEGAKQRAEFCRKMAAEAELDMKREATRTDDEDDATRESKPKYPDVRVRLVGEDGNVFAIIGRVRNALRKGGAIREEVEKFVGEATSGDYDHVLRTVMAWVEVE